jgi:nondiscriminating glutamyl-tRNA synthetase
VTRVRFAPSPTGGLHPGNARVAIFNYLFARHYSGVNILRFEDTDEERSSKVYEKSILEDLKWLSIDFDEGPFYQSKNIKRYKEVIEELTSKGFLFKCYCTKEELKHEREEQAKKGLPPKYSGKCKHEETCKVGCEYVLRFDVEKFIKETGIKELSYLDEIKGQIKTDLSKIGDFVIVKESGIPTYNFAVVVDDIDLKITHVFRGEDHISNTFRQIMIFKALAKDYPKYGHLPMLLAKDRTKLSKRSGGVPIHEFRKQGFLSSAVFVHLAFIGGCIGCIEEKANLDKMIENFNYKKTAVAPTVYDIEKLTYLNTKKLCEISAIDLLKILKSDFDFKTIVYKDENLLKIIEVLKEGARTLVNIIDDFSVFEESGVNKDFLKDFKDEEKNLFIEFLNNYKNINSFSDLKETLSSKTNLKGKKFFMPLRIFITGRTCGPSLKDVFSLISKDVLNKRIEKIRQVLNV